MIRSGLERLARIFLILVGGTAALSAAAGLVAGTPAFRAISLGFMLTGSFVFVIGAAMSLRGILRPTHREDGSRSGMRIAPPDEVRETAHLSAICVGLGLFLVLLGVAFDPRTDLF